VRFPKALAAFDLALALPVFSIRPSAEHADEGFLLAGYLRFADFFVARFLDLLLGREATLPERVLTIVSRLVMIHLIDGQLYR
tara:strand:- start:3715 stop:3963 length:249 start_codon:yes stop_codon:yes gene_type:complete